VPIKSKVLIQVFLAHSNPIFSAVESMLRKYASSNTAFSGTGRTLGGDPIQARGTPDGVNQVKAGISYLDPQLRIFLGLIGAYFVFWYLSS